MKPSFTHRLLSLDVLSPADTRSLLLTAEALKRAARSGVDQQLLKGKNIALLCDKAGCDCGAAVDAAATQLGARVSRIHADAVLPPDTARILGHLYDAIDCEHVPAEVASKLRQQVGVPVYEGLGRDDHPLLQLLGPADDADDRRFLVQALLVSTIG
jgi:ornithine carbamoyltransferase